MRLTVKNEFQIEVPLKEKFSVIWKIRKKSESDRIKGEGEILACEDRLELMIVKLKRLCLLRHICNQVSLQQHSHTLGRKSENTEGLKMC